MKVLFIKNRNHLYLFCSIFIIFLTALSLFFIFNSSSYAVEFAKNSFFNIDVTISLNEIEKSDSKKAYLTFDDGPTTKATAKILDILKEEDVKATFFVVSTFMKTNPELVKRMVDEGHIVGNHTMTHPNMSKMSTMEDFKSEIEPMEEMYKEITGKDMKKFYRPPQGVYSELNLKMAHELGYKTIFWSLAYVDWYQDKQPSKEEAFNKLIPRLHNGAIILLHSTSKTNAEILDELIQKIKQEGYEFSDLEELTGTNN